MVIKSLGHVKGLPVARGSSLSGEGGGHLYRPQTAWRGDEGQRRGDPRASAIEREKEGERVDIICFRFTMDAVHGISEKLLSRLFQDEAHFGIVWGIVVSFVGSVVIRQCCLP